MSAQSSRKKTTKKATTAKTTGKAAAPRKAAAGKKPSPKKPVARKKAVRKAAAAGRKGTAKAAGARVPRTLPRRASITLDPAAVSAWRMARQGLEQPALHTPHDLADALARGGWLSLGDGTSPYLSLAARFASFARHDLDRSLFREGSLMEVPAMRGGRVLLPPAEAWLALQAFRARVDALLKGLLSRHRLMTRSALANLEDVVRAVLAGQALPVETLRTRVPSRLLRDLGSHGARAGLPTSVDLALWHLWATGEVVSRPVERRLDRRRREYVLRRDLQGPCLTADIRMRPRDSWLADLSARYLSWAGLARLDDLAWWADVPAREAEPVLAGLGLSAVAVKGLRGIWLMRAEDLESLQSFRPPEMPAVSLLPREDMLTGCWRSYEGLLATAEVAMSLTPAQTSGSLAAGSDASAAEHFVVVGGAVAGMWEHLQDGSVRMATFRTLAPAVNADLQRRAAALAEFIRRDLRGAGAGSQGGGEPAGAERRWPSGAVRVNPGGSGTTG